MALSTLALLDNVAPVQANAAPTARPADAADCAIPGCDGWVAADKAIFVTRAGKALSGTCPRAERHSALVATSDEARTIRRRLTALFYDLNPREGRVKGSATVQLVVNARTGKVVSRRMSDGSALRA